MAEPIYDAFLSHNSQDKPLVREIARQLEARGLRCFLDVEDILPGEEFQRRTAMAMRNSSTHKN